MEVTMTNLINTFLNNAIGFDKFFDRFNYLSTKIRFSFLQYKKEYLKINILIEMALAGFDKDEINVHQTDEVLTIEASEKIKDAKEPEKEGHFISKVFLKDILKDNFN
jgi:HSP20 family molecular chaperone IbpA